MNKIVEGYLTALEKELIRNGYVIDNIVISASVAMSISANLSTKKEEQLFCFFIKHRFNFYNMTSTHYIFNRDVSDILNELRREGFKELIMY